MLHSLRLGSMAFGVFREIHICFMLATCKSNLQIKQTRKLSLCCTTQAEYANGRIWIERVSPRAPHKQRHGPLTSLGAYSSSHFQVAPIP